MEDPCPPIPIDPQGLVALKCVSVTGADIAFVQDSLGHANIHNTMVYIRYATAIRDTQTRQLVAGQRIV